MPWVDNLGEARHRAAETGISLVVGLPALGVTSGATSTDRSVGLHALGVTSGATSTDRSVGLHALGVALCALAEDADLRHDVTEDLQAARPALRVAPAARGPGMPQPELPEPPATDLHDTLAMATLTNPLVHSIEVPQGALAVVLASLTRLLEDDPTVCDVEINPLRVTDEGLVALDAVVLTTTPADAILARSTT